MSRNNMPPMRVGIMRNGKKLQGTKARIAKSTQVLTGKTIDYKHSNTELDDAFNLRDIAEFYDIQNHYDLFTKNQIRK